MKRSSILEEEEEEEKGEEEKKDAFSFWHSFFPFSLSLSLTHTQNYSLEKHTHKLTFREGTILSFQFSNSPVELLL